MDSLADSKDTKDGENINLSCPMRKKKLSVQIDEVRIWRAVFGGYEKMSGRDANTLSEQFNVPFATYINSIKNHRYTYGSNSGEELYFTLECMVKRFIPKGNIIVEITVDDDAQVLVEDGKMKADKVNIVSIIEIEDNTEDCIIT